MKKIPQDIIGDIAVLKFRRGTFLLVKKFMAWRFLKSHPHVRTVLEKTDKFSGRLRTPTTRWLAGYKTKIAHYKENGCTFTFDVDKTYFSPRLSEERKLVAEQINDFIEKNKVHNQKVRGRRDKKLREKKGAKVNNADIKILVMFSGVSPFPVVIAKVLSRERKRFKVYASELNRQAHKFALENVRLNKFGDYIELVPGDVSKLPEKFGNLKFDVIVMPRPRLRRTYLDVALKLSKKGAMILYHGFGTKEEVLSEIRRDARGRISKVSLRKAGDIAKGQFRWLASFMVKS